jgi:hypothetical protein
MNYRRFSTGLLLWLFMSGLTACQTKTKQAEQAAAIRADTTVFDDDTLEGAIKDTVRQPTKHNN